MSTPAPTVRREYLPFISIILCLGVIIVALTQSTVGKMDLLDAGLFIALGIAVILR